jgi:hypothetical protein
MHVHLGTVCKDPGQCRWPRTRLESEELPETNLATVSCCWLASQYKMLERSVARIREVTCVSLPVKHVGKVDGVPGAEKPPYEVEN